MHGFARYTLREGETNVDVLANDTFRSCLPHATCQYPPSRCPGPECPTHTANPTDPMTLTEAQKAAAITFEFECRAVHTRTMRHPRCALFRAQCTPPLRPPHRARACAEQVREHRRL